MRGTALPTDNEGAVQQTAEPAGIQENSVRDRRDGAQGIHHDADAHPEASLASPVEPPSGQGPLDRGAARRELLELSIAAAGIGTFDWDLASGTLAWDDRLVEQFGYDADGFDRSVAGFLARVHPDDRERVDLELRAAVEALGECSFEYRIVLPDGRVRWIGARGRALADERGRPVRLLGAAWDVTAHREAEARLAVVMESMSTAFFSLDTSWRFTYVNSRAEALLGRTRQEMLGGDVWELFPAAVGSDFETHYRRAMDTGEPVAFDAHYPAPLDAWYEVRAWRSREGLAVYFLDVTARRRLQESSEQQARLSGLLDHTTEVMVQTLEPEQAAAQLVRLVVPALADWGIVTLLDDDQQPGRRRGLRHAAAAHRDPALQDAAETYARTRMAALTDDSLFVRAMTTGQPQHLRSGATTDAMPMMRPGPVRDLLARLAPEAVLVQPLVGREGPVGLLTLCTGAERGPFSDADLTTIGDVAARAGLVLDNARLYRQQRDLAEGLQRSLLTAPPEPDHSQVVVRYVPAAEAAQVGGDWYDAFLQPDGATTVVIGDVVGHDTRAAAAMSQVRTLLRGIAVATGEGPAHVLRKVDEAIETLRVGTTATAVVARLEQSAGERARGVTRLRWSNAGHPPPMVINADGTVTALSGVTSDLLLGVLPGTSRRESEVTLDRGSIVLLYTDGLVERRGQSLEDGLVKLQDVLEDLGNRDVDELCDELLVHMLPDRREDDVALVAVKLHRQDEPRPESAGPRRIPSGVQDSPEVVPQPR